MYLAGSEIMLQIHSIVSLLSKLNVAWRQNCSLHERSEDEEVEAQRAAGQGTDKKRRA